MYYSNIFINQKKRIPILLIFSAVISFIMFTLVILIKPNIPSRANSGLFVTIRLVNVGPTQIGLFWHTNNDSSGVIKYGKDPSRLSQIAIDERDLENKQPGNYHNHYMLLKNLQPNTDYYYQSLFNGIQSQIEKTKTPETVKYGLSAKPIFGKIIQPNSQPVQNAIVLLEMDGFLPLLTTSKDTGEWLLSIEQSLANKANPIVMETWNEKSQITISIVDELGKTSTITGLLSTLNNTQRNFILGNNYNLVTETNVMGVQTQTSKKRQIDILYPKENSIIPAKSPLIKGIAIPLKEVYLSLNSQPQYNFRMKTNAQGEWKNVVSTNLVAGRYVIIMETENESGEAITIKRNFSIAKSGEQVLGTATPEAEPTLDIQPIIPTTYNITPTNQTIITPTITPPVSGQAQTIRLFLISAVALILGAGLVLAF